MKNQTMTKPYSVEQVEALEAAAAAAVKIQAEAADTVAALSKARADLTLAQADTVTAENALANAEVALTDSQKALADMTAERDALQSKLTAAEAGAAEEAARLVRNAGIPGDNIPAGESAGTPAGESSATVLDRINAIEDPAERTKFIRENRAALMDARR